MSKEECSIAPKQILLPLTLLSCAVLGGLVFNACQIWQGHESLRQVINQQDKPLEESKKIEGQLSALALGTKRLADEGNANAQGIVDALQKAGIKISGRADGVAGSRQGGPAGVVRAPVAPPEAP